jgi:hypothetical protein
MCNVRVVLGPARAWYAIASLLLACGLSASPAAAQVQLPPVNLGTTSFVDGIAGPGSLFQETFTYYSADQFRDGSGDRASSPRRIETAVALTHIAHISRAKLFGGYWGAEVLLPTAHVDLDLGPGLGGRETAIGDVTIAPVLLQWSGDKLLGRPYWHRLNLNVALPTGQYDPGSPVNIGSNVVQFNPHYAFTWEVSREWEISGRLHYLWVSENHDPAPRLRARSTQPGQAIHMNASVSREIAEGLRVGVAGYFLTQITDDEIDGADISNSRERVFGIGPGIRWKQGNSALTANGYIETGARDRPQGARFSLRYSRLF